MTTKVYKLNSDAYEVNEEKIVFSTYDAAREHVKTWLDFFNYDSVDAILKDDEIRISEWELK